jgi:predicted phage-related endonuclease
MGRIGRVYMDRMEKVNQNMSREEWLEWRHERLGASDANMMMGRSQYGTRQDLINAKAFPLVINSQPWLEEEKGEGEREAVELFCKENVPESYRVRHQFLISKKFSCLDMPLSCSLDAIVEVFLADDIVKELVGVEVKCVEKASDGAGIPPCYQWQLFQQNMLLNDYADMMHDKEMIEGGYQLYYVEYSKKQKKILKQVSYSRLWTGLYSSTLIDEYGRLIVEIESAKGAGLAEEYVAEGTKVRLYGLVDQYNELLPELEAARANLKAIEDKTGAIRDQISTLIGEQEHKFEHQGLNVQKVRLQGRIDPNKIPLNIPLHKVRGEDTFMLKITKDKIKKLAENVSFGNGKMEIK